MPFKLHKGAEAGKVAAWVAERIPGCARGFGPCVAMSVGDPIIAGVVFHNYSPESRVIEMSAAAESPRWLSRSVLARMHAYIFEDADCQMAVMRVSERNTRMLRIAKAFGYTAYKVPRLRGANEAEIILTLTSDQWEVSRFNGKTTGTRTA